MKLEYQVVQVSAWCGTSYDQRPEGRLDDTVLAIFDNPVDAYEFIQDAPVSVTEDGASALYVNIEVIHE